MKFFKSRKVKNPQRGTAGSAGIDFFVPDAFPGAQLSPGQSINIPSGIHVRLPPGRALIMFNKSGVALRNFLQVGACVIDEDYQGEVHLHVTNIGEQPTYIRPGMKLVQGLVINVDGPEQPSEVKSLEDLYENHESSRGRGGFGSTG